MRRVVCALIVSIVYLCVFSLMVSIADANSGQAATGPANPTNAQPGIPESIGQWIGSVVLGIGGIFTYIGGMLLENSLKYLVLDMGGMLQSISLGPVISENWRLIRDICNLAFIFGFIYVGVMTIADAQNSNTKRMIAQIIIGALLINFSLFFAKVIIEFSNLLSQEIFNALLSGQQQITFAFMNAMGISSFFSTPSPQILANLSAGGNVWFYIMGALLFMVAGFVFAAGAILLIVRFVVLIFLMIFSPLLFGAAVFPQTTGRAKQLWSLLISYSMFAPVFLLLLLVSLKVLTGLTAILNTGPLSDAVATGKIDSFGIFLNYTIAILFIIFSLTVAKKIGIAGGVAAVSLGVATRRKGQQYLGNMTFGAAAALGRNSIGKRAEDIANDQSLRDRAATNKFSMMKLRMAENMANRSFDARQVGGVGAKSGIGTGKTGGYRQSQKEINEQIEKRNKLLGTVDDTDVRVMARKKEMENTQREQRVLDEKLRQARQRGNEGDIIKARDAFENSKKTAEEAKLKYEQEKLRRTIGSSFATVDEKATENIRKKERELEITKNGPTGNGGLSEAWQHYLNPGRTEEEKRKALDLINKKNAEVMKLEEELKVLKANSTSDRGYAGAEERSRNLPTWMTGNLAWKRRIGGAELRAKAEKGLPKVTEDKK